MVDVVEQGLGKEGKLSLKFEGGKAKLVLGHSHASGSVSLVAEEDAGYFLDKLADAIPGDWDRAVIEVVKGIVKSL